MLLTKSVIRGENRDNQKKRSSRNNQIKRQKSVRLCVCSLTSRGQKGSFPTEKKEEE